MVKLRKLAGLAVLYAVISVAAAGCGDAEFPRGHAESPVISESLAFPDDAGGGSGTEESEADESGTREHPGAGEDVPPSEWEPYGVDGLPDGFVLPEYVGNPYALVNGNEPFFSEEERKDDSVFEEYSELDGLGRCGTAYANICTELMPSEKRGDISGVEPSGWNNRPYGFVDGGYIYNRCHLIGFQLAGENANERNLITGTRSMNVDGMLPFENMVHDYVVETGNHVLYRVTPVYRGGNLVADGVLMEACSVEDGGRGILFCVYCFNVQPGCVIDYSDGDNWADGESGADVKAGSGGNATDVEEKTYVLNTNSMKYHLSECPSVDKIGKGNRKRYTGDREILEGMGYEPCGQCRPDESP